MTHYKPYSAEWNRQRFLDEAISAYFNDGVEVENIYEDIMDVLASKADKSYEEFKRITTLENLLSK